ncbi:hypothetical protein BKA65DRAFT_117561 [Rhexocercosporidium sp. MPI-PUGE-AT-0058]|nr:hypothetical protein BKA65DRAFT_117561 [Rhexocercosporidium sp. MPI-PUGE-AT-0058]
MAFDATGRKGFPFELLGQAYLAALSSECRLICTYSTTATASASNEGLPACLHCSFFFDLVSRSSVSLSLVLDLVLVLALRAHHQPSRHLPLPSHLAALDPSDSTLAHSITHSLTHSLIPSYPFPSHPLPLLLTPFHRKHSTAQHSIFHLSLAANSKQHPALATGSGKSSLALLSLIVAAAVIAMLPEYYCDIQPVQPASPDICRLLPAASKQSCTVLYWRSYYGYGYGYELS